MKTGSGQALVRVDALSFLHCFATSSKVLFWHKWRKKLMGASASPGSRGKRALKWW